MAKKKSGQSSIPVTIVTVCPPASVHPTAFKFGFHHGYEKCRPRRPGSFAYQSTASAYALGYTAGRAARAAAKDLE